uniref:Tic22-like family protein n=1 Tax=Davidia involucrata TaxID=16924 RepID=A0A5B7BJN5_DAVIN
MASATDSNHHHHHINNISGFIQSTASNLSSLISFNTPKFSASKATPWSISSTTPYVSPSKICIPIAFADSPTQLLSLPTSSSFDSAQSSSLHSRPPSSSSALKGMSSESGSGSGFPSSVRISSLNSNGKGGGPAFVGQVFSMCDLSGTGLMAVSTHFDIPFISKRTPEWLKKMFATVTKSERNGPVFRFFMDLGDAVSYVKRLNIPSGVVGACRLDLAYEHFKEKPHLFQFVPNEKQVKEANKLLKTMPWNGGKKRVDGVPVFGAQNLDIAIATTNGIKWYTPYFFDKNMLDNILEESVDQHFHALIQTRHLQRRRDVIDDSLAAEAVEENAESIWEPPEVQEVLDEVGHPGIPLSVISKAAEIELLHAVDKVLLGNRWLRKATGIQPKFPYLVDSFEKRYPHAILSIVR